MNNEFEFEFECTYCDHKWIKSFYAYSPVKQDVCVNGNCGTKKLRIRNTNTTKVDYYKDCPPFSENPKKDWGHF